MRPNPVQKHQTDQKYETSNDILSFETTFLATPESVRENVIEVRDFLTAASIYPEHNISTEIVLAELLNNIVEHAYAGQEAGMIQLEVTYCDRILTLTTNDFGTPIPGLKVPAGKEPNLDVEHADLPEGSFGWFLIKNLARHSSYQRVGDTNRFKLILAL